MSHAPALSSWRFFAHEDDYPELDGPGSIERLAQAIRCRTTSFVDTSAINYEAFDELHGFIRRSYPHVMETAAFETVGHSLLITIPGRNPSLDPVLLMAHQDVVPVVPGTEGDWTHDAYSGYVDDTYVWGRGTLDVKEMLTGELEAAELALTRGGQPQRTIILAFGEDEECLQQGSRALARTLEERGIHPAFLIDEGPYTFLDGADYGAPGRVFKAVELGEKGYCDVRFTVHSPGGHSSNPFGGTSLASLCEAVTRITSKPWPVELSPLVQAAFASLAPHVTEEPFASLLAPLPGETAASTVARNASALARVCAERKPLFPLVTTTVAPTMLEGGSKGSNVMPQTVWAVVNFRLAPGVTSERVEQHCRELVADLPVEVDIFQQPSEPSEIGDGACDLGWNAVCNAVARYYVDPATGEGLPVVPTLATGGTDARMYEHLCGTCMRLGPMLVEPEETRRGVHGTDERIDQRAYLQSVRVLAHIIESTCW